MSQQITEAFVEEFSSGFIHVVQQKLSRLEPLVRVEGGIVGASKSINRLGARTAQRRTTRHGDTPVNDQPHSTRFIDLIDFEDGDLIDDMDKIRMLTDPQSEYVQAMAQALNRAKDDVIIAALGGNARASTGNVALPASQKVVHGGVGLTKAKLVGARTKFRANEADDVAGEDLYIAIGAQQLDNLLTDNSLTNTEILTVLDMQKGNFNTKIFGFTPVPLERLPKSGTTRYCYAWAKSGIALGIGADILPHVGPDPSKSFSARIYAKMSLGAVRIEEEKVYELQCTEV